MSDNVFFLVSLIVPIGSIVLGGLIHNSDWYQHRKAIRAVRYEAELLAARKALRDAQNRGDL